MRARDQVTPIDVLHDDVLLEILDFCLAGGEWWQSLVHVCRRWRSLVFQSPRRLNLRLFCTHRTPVREGLDVWPALPLVIFGCPFSRSRSSDNILVALEHSDRVCQIHILGLNDSLQWGKVLAAMQVPFPQLTDLGLLSDSETLPAIPDSFLGGSAPHLRRFTLKGIPFPGLPNLLLSSDHLVDLVLSDIPHDPHPGCISPKAMAALLSKLSSLRTFQVSLASISSKSRPDLESRSLPPLKRSILPSLDRFYFSGTTEYLEELVTLIDTPQLHKMLINFYNHIDLGTPRLAQFINVTPTLRAFNEAHLQFGCFTASVELRCRTAKSGLDSDFLLIDILCRKSDRLLSSTKQICNSSLPPSSKSAVEDLYIELGYPQRFWKNDAVENLNTLWLQLLLPFTAAQNLYIHNAFAPNIATALQELVGVRITEVLPSLQNIFVKGLEPSGPLQDNIGQFFAARRLSGHPIAISNWG